MSWRAWICSQVNFGDTTAALRYAADRTNTLARSAFGAVNIAYAFFVFFFTFTVLSETHYLRIAFTHNPLTVKIT